MRLLAFWLNLTEPNATVTDLTQRREARLLASLVLTFVPAVLALLFAQWFGRWDELLRDVDFAIIAGGLGVLIVAYLFSRVGRVRAAVVLTIATLIIGVVLLALPDSREAESGFLFGMIVPIMIASIFLSPLALALVMIIVIGVTLAVGALVPEIGLFYVSVGPLTYVVLTGILLAISGVHRRRLDGERQQELRENESRYRLLAENATDTIITTTRDGVLLYVSPASRALLGYAPEELIGRKLVDLLHPTDRAGLEALYAVVVTNEPFRTRPMGMNITSQGLVTLTYRMQHKQGRALWVEATNRAVASAGSTAPVDQVIASLRDVSERKQAEETLRAREAQYRTLVEQAADAILIADATGKLVEANPRACKMLGYNRDELLRLRLDQVVNADAAGAGYDQGTLLSERFAIQKNGDTLPVEMHAKLMLDGRLLAIVRDISERKEAENQRVELAVEKERVEVLQRFIGDASHDLRTPLAVMRTSLYILRRTQPELAEKGIAQITAIDDQITRMEGLLRDTLTMSRLDRADADEFSFALCDVNEIVRGVVERFGTAAQDKRVTLSFAPEQPLPNLRADSEQIARALGNLVKNAVSYTSENGTVQVRTYQQVDHGAPALMIEVKDNGIGINSLDLPHVFERFYRADPARRSVGAGMGLGLPIARRIVQAHGGEIRVESAIGAGSTFVICLPIKSASTPT